MGGRATLSLDSITVQRGGHDLISDLSLTLSGPKLLWVAGGNGIGKTSLLRTCAGLSRPAAGTVSWMIADSQSTAPDVIAFLPSDSYAKAGMTALEEAKFWGASLDSTNLGPHALTGTEKLSTGQKKRLSFAKLIAEEKPIWILDEPLAGLDADGRELIAQHLNAHVKSGGLAIVASHAPIPIGDISTQRLVLS